MDVADLKGCRGMARSKRTGQQCIRWAVVGTNVCDDYGGNAPQVIAAAKIPRLAPPIDRPSPH